MSACSLVSKSFRDTLKQSQQALPRWEKADEITDVIQISLPFGSGSFCFPDPTDLTPRMARYDEGENSEQRGGTTDRNTAAPRRAGAAPPEAASRFHREAAREATSLNEGLESECGNSRSALE